MKRKALIGITNCRKIKNDLGLQCSSRTIRRALKQFGFAWKSTKKAPMLKPRHFEQRLQFSRENLLFDWNSVIFSDEKRFSLDGPDSNYRYWHHETQEKRIFSRRQFGGGSVMVWGCFGVRGKSELMICDNSLTSARYQVVLRNGLLPHLQELTKNVLLFMHDNAPCHSARATKAWLQAHGIETLRWPACSPDLNPIENVWGIMTKRIYRQGRQYVSKDQLIVAIQEAWNDLPLELLQKLIGSMSTRVQSVIERRGGYTGY